MGQPDRPDIDRVPVPAPPENPSSSRSLVQLFVVVGVLFAIAVVLTDLIR